MDKKDKTILTIIVGGILNICICLVFSILAKNLFNPFKNETIVVSIPTKIVALPAIWTSTPPNNVFDPDIAAAMLVWRAESDEFIEKFAIAQPLFNEAIQMVPSNNRLLLSSEFKDNIKFFLLEMTAASRSLKDSNCPDPELWSDIDLLDEEINQLNTNLDNSIATLNPFLITDAVQNSTNTVEIFERIRRQVDKYP
ncbi:MAG TPA: hypothetical protein VFC41_02200 [Anaerovoracaceae bacterium]|nr:hypothetical protein [Anaerovoracaceae bacterium]